MRYVKRESMKDFARKMVERYQIIDRLRKQDEERRKQQTPPPTMPHLPA